MNQYTNTDSNVQHSEVYLTGRFRRDVTTVTPAGNVYTVNPNTNDQFIVNAGVDTQIQFNTITADNVGQSGIIIIICQGGASFRSLPVNCKTPSGALIEFVTDPESVSIISYMIAATDKILCNYVGNFA
tara:strand:- start:1680 stop:2066 length:387 start_codon:yes stop_codon:yes gene_type:complete